MGFAKSIARASTGPLSGIATPEKWVEDWVRGGVHNSAGVRVDHETAMHYSPFFAGVRVISEDVASLPLPLYERLARGKNRAREHPLYQLLRWQPNDMMTSVQLRETLQGHALTWGNGVAELVTHPRTGVIEEIWPLRPDRLEIKVKRIGAGRLKRWYVYDDNVNGIHAVLPAERVLHVAGLGFDGVRGYSVVEHAANSIGLGLATEHYGAKFFANGASPGGALSHPGQLSEGARKRMATDWENLHKGIDRAHRVAILEEGVTWQKIGIPNDAAQYLETRKLQVTEMARWLRLPAHKINDLERSTYSNIESQQLDYVTSALQIWLTRWEQAIYAQLLTTAEQETYFAEHLVDGLLRGDSTARFQSYATARQWGWMSANDVREKENQNPVEGGDTYLVPLNMVPASGAEADPDRSGRTRSTAERRRIAGRYRSKIAAADRALAKYERTEVERLVREHLEPRGRSTSAFLAAVTELFETEVEGRLIEAWLPVLTALADDIAVVAAEEAAFDEETDLAAWLLAYVTSHSRYQIGSALGQLTSAVEGAADAAAAAVAVRALLAVWVKDRPKRTARWQSVQLSAAAAREIWKAAGVRRLRWKTHGRNCTACSDLDGTVVGIDEPFIAAGTEADNGDDAPHKVGRNTYHPPIHPGCDCDIEVDS